MIFIILGMHKSGTTLLARALHESDVMMGESFPPGVEYAKAKYEARWVQEMIQSVYVSHLARARVALPLSEREHPLR